LFNPFSNYTLSCCSLVTRAAVSSHAHTTAPPFPRHLPRPPGPSSTQREGSQAGPLDTFRAAVIREGASPQVAEFLQASFKPSSLRAYSSAWKHWSSWCELNNLGHNTPTVGLLLNYLWDLYSQGRVYGSIGVHRSALSSLSQPGITPALGAHPLVSRFMKAVFLSRPPARMSLRPTWDVAEVLQYLSSWPPPRQLSLQELSHKTVTLVALSSMRRISDLTLLNISQGHMALSQDKIVFQLKFGLKQERPGHTSPVITFDKITDHTLCTVTHITEYLARVSNIRSDSALFVTTTPPHHRAAKHTLRSWVVKVLSGAGISHPAGSTRAAAATYATASRIPLSSILQKGDWARASTLYNHYVRHLPQASLQRMADS